MTDQSLLYQEGVAGIQDWTRQVRFLLRELNKLELVPFPDGGFPTPHHQPQASSQIDLLVSGTGTTPAAPPPAATDGQPTGDDAAETTTIQPTGATTPKEPPKEAFAVYRYQLVTGMNQTELASDPKLMEQLGRKRSQGTISRWLDQVKKWIKSGKVLPDLPENQGMKPASMDPERMNLGPRQDDCTPRQRERRSTGDAD